MLSELVLPAAVRRGVSRTLISAYDAHSNAYAPLQAAKAEVAEQMGELLTEAGMKEVLCLPKARVPVVKFQVGATT